MPLNKETNPIFLLLSVVYLFLLVSVNLFTILFTQWSYSCISHAHTTNTQHNLFVQSAGTVEYTDCSSAAE